MKLLIERFINSPIASNCYLIRVEGFPNCLLVDPSFTDESVLDAYLLNNRLTPDFIIITHEHFDHIQSIDFFRNKFQCKAMATVITSEAITDPKKNLSLFYDRKGFSCEPADVLIGSNITWPWMGHAINFFLAPGHSAGGLGFEIDNLFFVGDTLIKEAKTVVKLPGGSRAALLRTMTELSDRINPESTIFPGHGNTINFTEFNMLKNDAR